MGEEFDGKAQHGGDAVERDRRRSQGALLAPLPRPRLGGALRTRGERLRDVEQSMLIWILFLIRGIRVLRRWIRSWWSWTGRIEHKKLEKGRVCVETKSRKIVCAFCR